MEVRSWFGEDEAEVGSGELAEFGSDSERPSLLCGGELARGL